MLEIYLCHICSDPIWFPHGQKMDLGTGWDCWRQQQTGEGKEGPAGRVSKFVFSTPPKKLKSLTDKAITFYRSWCHDYGDRRVIKFLTKQLAEGKSDVVHQFLAHLLEKE